MKETTMAMFSLIISAVMIFVGCSKEKAKKKYVLATSAYPAFYLTYIAQEEGFYEKYGLDVNVVYFPVYSDSVMAFSTGQADVIAIAMPDTIAPYINGVPIEVIAMLDNSSGADGIVGREGINTLADLKGKSVATEYGTIEHFFLAKRLESAGLSMKDIKFVNLSIADSGPAFLAKTVDAASLWEPTLSESLSRPGCKLLTNSEDTPGLIADVLAVNKNMPESDKIAFIKAIYDSLDFYYKNPQKAISDMAKCAEISEEDMWVSMSGSKLFGPKEGYETLSSDAQDFTALPYDVQEVAEFLYSIKMIETCPDVKGVINAEYAKKVLDEIGDFPVPDTKKY
ncbi:MAG: ABC transporter substrate-binding protein [Treponema sp.]|nr:ABC transporter substrate-binding protein [Treponema sp.]